MTSAIWARAPLTSDRAAHDAVTSSGSMEFGTLSSGATMRSAYGAVRVRDIVRGAVRVDGSYGSVDVGVRQGTAVWVTASCGSSTCGATPT